MTCRGYIVIPNWEHFQHYKDRRPAWVKLHLDLLGNDAWLELSPDDRCLLITIWMLVGRYGQGRVKADLRWLQAQANLPLSNRYQGLERLNDAGFIQFCASPVAHVERSLEVEGSKEPKKEKENARANGASSRGSYAAQKKQLANAIAGARALTQDDPPHLAEQTIREAYPDELVPQILASLNKETSIG